MNIDEDSSVDEKSLGKKICEKHKIQYMDREERGMLNNIDTSQRYFSEKNIHWVIWFQHDCFPLTERFFTRFNSLVSTGQLDNFGLVGFNTYHRGPNVLSYKNGSRELQNIARAILEPGDNWYRHKSEWQNTRAVLSSGKFDKPFAVEIPAAFSVAVNLKLYKEIIQLTDDYHFMNTFDEIGFQFLYNNIYNISIPYLHLGHEDERKLNFGIPRVSSKHHEANNKGKYEKDKFDVDNKFFGKWGLSVVYDRWGIDVDNGRESFELVKHNYKDTLMYEFYNHDPINGPLKSFPEIIYEEDR